MARVVNIHEAKTHLSRLVEDVLAGESITIAKAGVPMVDLTIHTQTKRRFGSLSGVARHSKRNSYGNQLRGVG
jgi:antitoxin (DNA-binding transcriptional repressor) of toxin-antitoxin stability system